VTRAQININPDGTGLVLAFTDTGTADISSAVTSVSVNSAPGRGCDILLGMRQVVYAAEGAGRIDSETAGALIALGWTPPDAGVATTGNQ
jgi:hypothetical protein